MRVSEQEDSINLQSNNAKALFDEVKNLVVRYLHLINIIIIIIIIIA